MNTEQFEEEAQQRIGYLRALADVMLLTEQIGNRSWGDPAEDQMAKKFVRVVQGKVTELVEGGQHGRD